MSRVVLARDVVVQTIGGEALVLNLRTETVYSLNASGARIAELIADGLETDTIVERLAREYGAEREAVARDVADLVAALLDKGLVTRVEGSAT